MSEVEGIVLVLSFVNQTPLSCLYSKLPAVPLVAMDQKLEWYIGSFEQVLLVHFGIYYREVENCVQHLSTSITSQFWNISSKPSSNLAAMIPLRFLCNPTLSIKKSTHMYSYSINKKNPY